jgi:acetoacetyl-CoA synthetase
VSDQPLWTPDPEQVGRTNMALFMARVASRSGDAASYEDLWRWSVTDLEGFWGAMWDYAGMVASQPAERVLGSRAMPGAEWFPGSRLNFAENLLRHRESDRTALVSICEHRPTERVSYAELAARVVRCAAALRAVGVGQGDRVAAYVPNFVPSVVGMLAATSLGAVWSSSSPDFGVEGVLDRFGQIEPKVLITADGYRYGGKSFDIRAKVQAVAEGLPTLEQVVVVPWLEAAPDLGSIPTAVTWDAFLASAPEQAGLEFEQLPFDHPVYVLYSSGTTGVPKCIVHGAGGTLLQHAKELMLHTDLKPDDNLVYFTTCGWMMWNWLVSGLMVGCTLTLYDGSPGYPELGRLWQMVDEEGITVFGTSAKYLGMCRGRELTPGRDHQLTSLRGMLSTGSPLLPEDFDWVYAEVKQDLLLASISGGTDLISCFVLGCPTRPVYRGEIQCRGLGMAVEAFGPDAQPVRSGKGELVCTQPFASMPVSFWNDPDGARYRKAYFERFEGVWTHGDFVEITEHDGVVIYGRSDATLNPGGVRIGTAEIYRQVETMPQVADSIAVGRRVDGDVEVVLFVQLREGGALDDELIQEIKRRIRAGASPRHVPSQVLAVPAIPYTRSGKKVELAVTQVLHGEEPANKHALANPEALEHFRP